MWSGREPSGNGLASWAVLEETVAALKAMANVTLLPRTTAIGYYHQNFLGLCQRLTDHLAEPPATAPRERMWRVRAEQVVLAQGAIEKPLVFDGRSEEHTSELQSLMRISYAVFCLQKK